VRINKLRQLLDDDRPSLGAHVHSTWPNIVEAVGHTGLYDYVEFVAEYAPFDLYALENFCRAAELYGMSTMIKVDPEPRRFLAQRAIGCGFQSVLFADCHTPEEARECVRIVRPATPEDGGWYGASMRRHVYMTGYGTTSKQVQSLRDIVVGLMVEKRSAVEQLEEILSVPSLDLICFGPADYSINTGLPPDRRSPQIRAVERRVIETALRMGIQPRIDVGSLDDVRYYLELGARHFCLTSEVTIIYNWLMENGKAIRKELS
jgi:2-keto-3-deoxy-L-rhamnonate aldolase RhmA